MFKIYCDGAQAAHMHDRSILEGILDTAQAKPSKASRQKEDEGKEIRAITIVDYL